MSAFLADIQIVAKILAQYSCSVTLTGIILYCCISLHILTL